MGSAARRMNKKKTTKIIKKQLLASILDVFEKGDDLRMNEEVKNANPERWYKFKKKALTIFERGK